ncbi:hypothetical protein K501DRAFT_179016, partial [Backusella circina FSU 941]
RKANLPAPTPTASKIFNLTTLPTNGEYAFTFRPGTIQWKTPKKLAFQPTQEEAQPIELDPVFRLPIDDDDTGAQVRFEWGYNNLKIRPKKITIEAMGPNKAIYSVAELEGTKTTAIWHLRETPSYSPLVEGHYTILFHDQRGRDTLPKPGWLLPDDKMKIALYRTEGRHVGQDIKPSECATCFSFAMQSLESSSSLRTSSGTSNYVHLIYLFIVGIFWVLL